MKDIELLPCPFCGSSDIANVSAGQAGPSNHWHAGDEIFAVNCRSCGASVPQRYRNDLVVDAWNARAAVEANRAPDGWKLVPVEPTDEMVRASLHLDLSYMPGHEGPDRASVYKAMLSASPAQQKRKPMTWSEAKTLLSKHLDGEMTGDDYIIVKAVERHHGIRD